MFVFLTDNTKLKDTDHLRCLRELPSERQQTLRSFRFEADYLASLAGDLLLKYALRTIYGVEVVPAISTGENGKPFFPDSDIHFNISHSGKYTVCAIGDTPVGVDIQEIDTDDQKQALSIARHFFSEQEIESITGASDMISHFFTIWCLKESYVKYTGTGMIVPLDSISFVPDKDSNSAELFIDGQKQSSPYFYITTIDERYRFSICSEDMSISRIDIDPLELAK